MNGILKITGITHQNINITQSYLDANMKNGIVYEGNSITFMENITWNSNWSISINNSDNNNQIYINGGGYSIYVHQDFSGLIVMNDECYFKVENINIFSNNENNNIGNGNGSIIKSYIGGFINFTIFNCTSNITSNGNYSGGIVGKLESIGSSKGKISDCITTGNIIGDYAGGIIGQSNINLIINNCTSSGKIMGYNSAGIIAKHIDTAELYIYNCHSSGTITRKNNAGILGTSDGNIKIYINACYSLGHINGENNGGIMGSYMGNNSEAGYINVANCYSRGEINGYNAGGIIGGYTTGNCKIRIYCCFSLGDISGNQSGGIIGGGIMNTNLIIANCFSQGNINGNKAGGLMGSNVGSQKGFNIIYGCYSTGNINGDYTGGLCGTNQKSSLYVYGFYAAGINNGSGTGGLAGEASDRLAKFGHIESAYTRQSRQTDPDPFLPNSHYDGSNDVDILFNNLSAEYGFINMSPYPCIKSFTQSPWMKYHRYNDHPELDHSQINVNIEDLNILEIHITYYIIDIVLYNYNHIFNTIPVNNINNWSFIIFNNKLGHKHEPLMLSDLTTNEYESIISSIH